MSIERYNFTVGCYTLRNELVPSWTVVDMTAKTDDSWPEVVGSIYTLFLMENDYADTSRGYRYGTKKNYSIYKDRQWKKR